MHTKSVENSTSSTQKFSVPNMNIIRAICALIVLLWHVDQHLPDVGIPSIGFGSNGMASQAVNFFFLLSGFLITQLLFQELASKKRIGIKDFYLRRILRIWPIYYLVCIVTLFLSVYCPSFEAFAINIKGYLLTLAMMPNIALITHTIPAIVNPLWSIGVEEQFYIFWPLFVLLFHRHFLAYALTFISLFWAAKLGVYLVFYKSAALSFFHYSRFDVLVLGGVFGYLRYTKNPVLSWLYNKWLFMGCLAIFSICLWFGSIQVSSLIDNQLNAMVYAIILINLSNRELSYIPTTDTRVTRWLGNISYGMYVYHMLIIFTLCYCIKQYHLQFSVLTIFTTVLGATLVVATLSYRYFESIFLRWKARFTHIKSGV